MICLASARQQLSRVSAAAIQIVTSHCFSESLGPPSLLTLVQSCPVLGSQVAGPQASKAPLSKDCLRELTFSQFLTRHVTFCSRELWECMIERSAQNQSVLVSKTCKTSFRGSAQAVVDALTSSILGVGSGVVGYLKAPAKVDSQALGSWREGQRDG